MGLLVLRLLLLLPFNFIQKSEKFERLRRFRAWNFYGQNVELEKELDELMRSQRGANAWHIFGIQSTDTQLYAHILIHSEIHVHIRMDGASNDR